MEELEIIKQLEMEQINKIKTELKELKNKRN